MNFLQRLTLKRRIKRKFLKTLGYKPDFDNPQSYCEKIQWLKLNHNGQDPRIIERADKYAVRSYIKESGFADCLVDLYGCWQSPEEINWDELPERFVLKLNNASGNRYCWFVDDRDCFDKEQFQLQVKQRMTERYGQNKGELHYSKMPVRIIAEQYLVEDGGRPIIDYKFYCFHGRVVFFSVEEGKVSGNHVREYFSRDWQSGFVDFYNDVPRPEIPFQCPDDFLSMLEMAETLSQGYPLLRVDLYNVNGKIYFGELTYTPEDGVTQWKPTSLDYDYGKLMDLDNITH